MHVLVTGGAGFIGSHVVDLLITRGHRVTVIDNLSTGSTDNLNPQAAFHQVSVGEPRVRRLLQRVDAVVHAAARTSVARSVTSPAVDAQTNIIGTMHLMETAADAGAGRVVYLSSAAVYGAPLRVPIPEEHPTCPSSPYGLSKLAAEQYVRLLAEAANMAWTSLRLANVYGPRQSVLGEAGVIARWCGAIASGQPIVLEGNGLQTRDFVFVQDVARAVVLAVEAPETGNGVMNIGTGQETSLLDLLSQMESASGRSATLVHRPSRPGDIRRSVLDVAMAWQTLGWRARHHLGEGLVRTLAWVLTQRPAEQVERGI